MPGQVALEPHPLLMQVYLPPPSRCGTSQTQTAPWWKQALLSHLHLLQAHLMTKELLIYKITKDFCPKSTQKERKLI